MKLLQTLMVKDSLPQKRINFYQGDLTLPSSEHPFDMLIVSAFQDDYVPVPNSLIGALQTKGISVANLAKNKKVDLRENFACWLSHELNNSKVCFKYILCFESKPGMNPADYVTGIFQAILSIVLTQKDIKTIALPVLSTGNQNVNLKKMLFPILTATLNWLKTGLPIDEIMIVEKSEVKADQIINLLPEFADQYKSPISRTSNSVKEYDVFISYSHSNTEEMLFVVGELRKIKPDIKLFVDHKELIAGSSWQQEIYEAIDNSRLVLTLISPTYLSSSVCKEEYNIAVFRHRESDKEVLIPIYLYNSNLPTYMKLVQYNDCREFSKSQISTLCKLVVEML